MGLEQVSADISCVVGAKAPVDKPKPVRLPLIQVFQLKSLTDGLTHILGFYEQRLGKDSSDGEIYNLYSLILKDFIVQNKSVPKNFTYSNVHAHYKPT